jgi:hypothetical protein
MILTLLLSLLFSPTTFEVEVTMKAKYDDVLSCYYNNSNQTNAFTEQKQKKILIEKGDDWKVIKFSGITTEKLNQLRIDFGRLDSNEFIIKKIMVKVNDIETEYLPKEILEQFYINKWVDWSLQESSLIIKSFSIESEISDPFIIIDTRNEKEYKNKFIHTFNITINQSVTDLLTIYHSSNKKINYDYKPSSNSKILINKEQTSYSISLKSDSSIRYIGLDFGKKTNKSIKISKISILKDTDSKFWDNSTIINEFAFNIDSKRSISGNDLELNFDKTYPPQFIFLRESIIYYKENLSKQLSKVIWLIIGLLFLFIFNKTYIHYSKYF